MIFLEEFDLIYCALVVFLQLYNIYFVAILLRCKFLFSKPELELKILKF